MLSAEISLIAAGWPLATTDELAEDAPLLFQIAAPFVIQTLWTTLKPAWRVDSFNELGIQVKSPFVARNNERCCEMSCSFFGQAGLEFPSPVAAGTPSPNQTWSQVILPQETLPTFSATDLTTETKAFADFG